MSTLRTRRDLKTAINRMTPDLGLQRPAIGRVCLGFVASLALLILVSLVLSGGGAERIPDVGKDLRGSISPDQ